MHKGLREPSLSEPPTQGIALEAWKGRIGNRIFPHCLMKRPFFLILSAFSIFCASKIASAAPIEPITVPESPCSEDRTIENTMCHMGRRSSRVQNAFQNFEGRTASILRKRQEDQRSFLVPRSQRKPTRVDLRPSAEIEKELPLPPPPKREKKD